MAAAVRTRTPIPTGKTTSRHRLYRNHRSFLIKPRTLFQIEGGSAEISNALRLIDEGRGGELLPPGCSVTYDLEAKEILRALLARDIDRPQALLAYYQEFRDRTGVRPTASEAYHDGYDPRAARMGYGSWLQFVRTMGDLKAAEDDVETKLRPFLSSLETTPLTRSYKMVVLLAMLAEQSFPGSIPIERLAARVRILARRTAALRSDVGAALDDDVALIDLLVKNPVAAWVEGRGTGGDRYFAYDAGVFSTTLSIPTALKESAAELTRELVEWRLATYLRRTGIPDGAPRIYCNVSHSGDRPILFLPSRDRVAGIPTGWVDVVVDGEAFQANFVKIAINVMHRPGSDENILPDLMRRWFGANAGRSGTVQRVVFQRSGEGYLFAPDRGEEERGPRLWMRYLRAEVPKLFGFEFKGFESQTGVVERPGVILLFVTLDKKGKPQEHQYEDKFLSPTEFQWQSQNQTSRESEAGRRLSEGGLRNIAVHLFVRRVAKVGGTTQPFIYCGPLEFVRWEGDRPITFWWKLQTPVPTVMLETLNMPES